VEALQRIQFLNRNLHHKINLLNRMFSIKTVPLVFAAALLTLAGCATPNASSSRAERSQFYELRVYSTHSEGQQKRISDHWQNAAIPAYNRIGVQSIGVFTEHQDSPTNHVYVLLPFDSAEQFAIAQEKLLADATYQQAAADYANLPKEQAAFDKLESSLLIAFKGMPRMASLPATGDRSAWVFELRTYFSPSESRGWNKIKMFNDGEIKVMQDVGLAPLFFGQNLTGTQLPALTYMTCGETLEEHQKHWRAFGSAPGWNALKNDPQYKDNMTGMSRVILKRTAASQL